MQHFTLHGMRVIGFDTATPDTVVGALDGDRVTFEFRGVSPEGTRPSHSSDLVPAIEQAADSLGGWSRVDRLAVGVGPGTFTGLRIGIAPAHGIRLSSGAEIVPVCSLQALAGSIPAPPDTTRIPVIDASRGEVFLAAYDGSGRELFGPSVGPPNELFERIATTFPDPAVAGAGALRFRSDLEAAGLKVWGDSPDQNRVSGRAICEAALSQEPSPNKEPIEPIYLRAPDAERWIARDSGPGN